ncbi:uncharacterized protein LOC124140214 isoform X1 [Haliotis rufescens]|uniref:uncharacterized protein LOC124140214 isoform X1 n=1 Tax=Haliotis rufescens TaxID=6454 RepID=UPI00201FA2C1|nr:uncharacterized protein LOC124140214 isoform X1 [Haliotis rufescens]
MSRYAGPGPQVYPSDVYPGQRGYNNPYANPQFKGKGAGADVEGRSEGSVGSQSPIAVAFRRDAYLFSPQTGDDSDNDADLQRSHSDSIRPPRRGQGHRRNSDPNSRSRGRRGRRRPQLKFRNDKTWHLDMGTQVDDKLRHQNVATSTHWKPYVERHSTPDYKHSNRTRGKYNPKRSVPGSRDTVDRGMQTYTPPASPTSLTFETDLSGDGLSHSDTDWELKRPSKKSRSGTDNSSSDTGNKVRRRGGRKQQSGTDDSEPDKTGAIDDSPRSRRVGVTQAPGLQSKTGKQKKKKKVRVSSPREVAAYHQARLQEIEEEEAGGRDSPSEVRNSHNTDEIPDDLKSLSAKHYLKKIGRLNTELEKKSNQTNPRGDRFVMAQEKPQYVIRSNNNSREVRAHSSSSSSSNHDQSVKGTSSGKTDGDSDILDHLDDFNIVEEYDGNDIYLCYLMTDSGATIGPMRLDIEDIEIGLPGMNKGDNSDDKGDNSQEEEDEGHSVNSDTIAEEDQDSDNIQGLRNRQTGSHGLNEFSSRSHSMLTVTIDSETQPDQEDENLYVTKRGKLSFVDLAGSEKVKDNTTGAGAGVMYESNSINKSLLVLGNCISHLGDSKRRHGHIPYRDSKLTKLLADSLGGNGVTLMITCITPSSCNVAETMNTLRYASRAKKIKTKPTVKMDPREKLILSLKREIKILRNENHYLRQQLEFPAKPKGQLQKENDEKFMKFMKEQQQKESGLYEMLQEYMVENENLRGENSDLHAGRDKVRREQQTLYRENEKLMKRVEDLERIVSKSPAAWQQAQRPLQRYDGFNQYDMGSPRQSPGQNGHRIPQRLPHQDLPHPDPTSLVVMSPPGGHPMRPPHRLPDPVIRGQKGMPESMQNGGHMMQPHGRMNGPVRQASPPRATERRSSQASQSDAIRDMNEKLLLEVRELEGEIEQQHRLATRSHDLSQRPRSDLPHKQYPGSSTIR